MDYQYQSAGEIPTLPLLATVAESTDNKLSNSSSKALSSSSAIKCNGGGGSPDEAVSSAGQLAPPSSPPPPPLLLGVSKARWWIMAAFTMMAFMQGVIWSIPGFIAPTYKKVFGLDDFMIQVFVGYGPFFWFASCFPAMLHMDRHGAKVSVQLSAGAVLTSSILRCVAAHLVPGSVVMMHVAFAVNALAGPVSMGACCRLSEDWFPLSERVTATSLMVQGNLCASLAMYLLVPVVNDEDAPSLQRLEYIVLAMSALTAAMCLAYFPSHPPLPPSQSAALRLETRAHLDLTTVLRGLGRAARSRKFLTYFIVYSCVGGLYSTLGSLSTPVLGTLGLDQGAAGWVGFGTTCCSVAMAVVIARVADLRKNGVSKTSVASAMLMAAVFYSIYALILGGQIDLKYQSAAVTIAVLVVVMVGAGCLFDAVVPVMYEQAMEASFPLTEGVALVVINSGNNFVTAITVLVPIDDAGTSWMPWAMAALNLGAAVAIWTLPPDTAGVRAVMDGKLQLLAEEGEEETTSDDEDNDGEGYRRPATSTPKALVDEAEAKKRPAAIGINSGDGEFV